MKTKFKITLLITAFVFTLSTAGCTKTKDTVAPRTDPIVVGPTSPNGENPSNPGDVPQNNNGTATIPPEASAKDYIFPDSQVKKLSGEDLMRLQFELLPFALNEIFARRGYIFETQLYKDYFSKKAWYKPDTDFKYDNLTDVEYYNVTLIKYFINRYKTGAEPSKPQLAIYKSDTTVLIDLNGDGVNEKIIYSASKSELSINNNIQKLSLDNPVESFAIADINKNDSFKEVLVSDYGPSDDYRTLYYSFDGTKVIDMGKTQGLFDSGINLDGSGMITARTRGQILQTWFFNKSYRLNDVHLLEQIYQDLYATDYDVFLKIPLKLYKNKGDAQPTLLIKEGQIIKITGTDDVAWCLLKTSDGTMGWIALDKFSVIRNNGLQAPEVFEGLSYAD